MDTLLATARRPVSDRGETRCRGERRRSSSRHRGHPKKALSKRHQGTPRGEPRNRRRQLTELFPPISKVRPKCRSRSNCQILTIEPDLSLRGRNRPKFHIKKQRPPGRIKSLQEGLDHSWDAQAVGQTFARSFSAPKMQWRRYDLHSQIWAPRQTILKWILMPHWSEPTPRVLRRWERVSAFGQMVASGAAVESAF